MDTYKKLDNSIQPTSKQVEYFDIYMLPLNFQALTNEFSACKEILDIINGLL